MRRRTEKAHPQTVMHPRELERLRARKGWTWKWIAHETGVDVVTAQRWVATGRRRVPPPVARLLRVLAKP